MSHLFRRRLHWNVFLLLCLLVCSLHGAKAQNVTNAQSPSTCTEAGKLWSNTPTSYLKGYSPFSSRGIDSLPFVGKTIHVDEEPMYQRSDYYKHIVYPNDEKRIGIEASVNTVVLVSANGTVAEVFVMCAEGVRTATELEHFYEAILKSLKKTEFLPGKKAGKTVDSWLLS